MRRNRQNQDNRMKICAGTAGCCCGHVMQVNTLNSKHSTRWPKHSF